MEQGQAPRREICEARSVCGRAIHAWCRLVSVADGEISERGQADAARFLLAHQTPASIVAAAPASSEACDVAQRT